MWATAQGSRAKPCPAAGPQKCNRWKCGTMQVVKRRPPCITVTKPPPPASPFFTHKMP
ncbi:MAG: hypothetical protein PUF74_00620 [Sodaliphilus pleomorphus]|uniref:hypothetical protein n=1 Tax=Sodaliphilus pleomorphus TaxID=2606626 RepID=UPI002409EFD6|nr:hypothetical protein [Sodaliphilus pleomorphus]MDD6474009.1 hypothetical protein [Sodaliphilus pleomorphus]